MRVKEVVQRVGRSLSAMVMPNIGAFIAWGFITALFIPDGWIPNARFAELVGPMITYLLPLLIGFTGGFNIWRHRGGVVGAVATMGVIVGADVPMFLGAMIAGPLGGWCIKKFDQFIERHIPAGFEMLINNFSAGIIGLILALLGAIAINPATEALIHVLSAGVQFLINHGLLPLTAVFVEPAKVLFLNNAINHGIFTPLGAEQVLTAGKSIIFMIESNPGPGLGLLLGYMVAGKGMARSSAPGAAIIHFFGGIHEIYFPYVLMNPVLVLATMGGSASGLFVLSLLHGGLVGAASPGSIIAQMAMTPRGGYLANIAGIAVSIAVSFVLTVLLLKMFGKDTDLEEAQGMMQSMKSEAKGIVPPVDTCAPAIPVAPIAPAVPAMALANVRKVVFACDAGMGSSAMGSTLLRKKLKTAGLDDIEVVHSPVSEIPSDAQVIVTHRDLGERAAHSNPNAKLVLITNFMAAPEYDTLAKELADARK